MPVFFIWMFILPESFTSGISIDNTFSIGICISLCSWHSYYINAFCIVIPIHLFIFAEDRRITSHRAQAPSAKPSPGTQGLRPGDRKCILPF
jgi:hypothetical protein